MPKMKMRPEILRTGRQRGGGDGAFIESSSAGAGRDGDWMRGQRIALKLRAQRLRAQGGGTGEREAGQRGNAILPTRAPGSFKRSSESAKRKRAHGVVGPRRGPGDPEGRWPPPPTDSRLDGERSSRASSCAHGTRASVRRRWPPRVTGESRDYATDATA